MWNWVGGFSLYLNAFTMIELTYRILHLGDLKRCAAINSLLMWFQILYWLRSFRATAFYWEMIMQTLLDIRSMMLILFTFLIAFGNALYYLDSRDDTGEWLLVNKVFGNHFIDAVFGQYLLGLGEFSTDNFEQDGAT